MQKGPLEGQNCGVWKWKWTQFPLRRRNQLSRQPGLLVSLFTSVVDADETAPGGGRWLVKVRISAGGDRPATLKLSTEIKFKRFHLICDINLQQTPAGANEKCSQNSYLFVRRVTCSSSFRGEVRTESNESQNGIASTASAAPHGFAPFSNFVVSPAPGVRGGGLKSIRKIASVIIPSYPP